ncbi:site-specific integrase [Vibrio breoganii]|uniref:site-specific integrase n=1 Tax=Vibrio breoganii TaxID=553239 RepID=UPI000C831FFF|nr:site-specific integrase [Vibrio breoganii]PML85230.1 hypothetical protein BCT68_07815 [Vibrio breoganii]
MGQQSAQQKRNRSSNSGGVAPDAQRIATTLTIALHRLQNKGDNTRVRQRKQVTFITWWLSNELLRADEPSSLPNYTKVTGRVHCAAHCLRVVKIQGQSWAEYAQVYPHGKEVTHHWQPIPVAFNALFCKVISTCAKDALLLSPSQFDELSSRLTRKWKTLGRLSYQSRVRKDRLFQFWAEMIQTDPHLSALAKATLLPSSFTHHRNARFYQTETTDRLRYHIFHAHNRYCDRIATALVSIDARFGFSFPDSKSAVLPEHLTGKGALSAFQRIQDNSTHFYRAIAPVEQGSSRALSTNDTRRFFRTLTDTVNLAKQDFSTKAKVLEYYNWRTYHIAFLFLILTGVRPTHAISIRATHCFDYRQAIVKDKGRYRSIWLCDYFHDALKEYLAVQRLVCLSLDCRIKTPWLWYLLNKDGVAIPLTAKTLRHTMNRVWQSAINTDKVTPYQLRHTFAQIALTSDNPKLTTQQIDRLMGHAQFGEHLGNDLQFPASCQVVRRYLNTLASRLELNAPDKTVFSFEGLAIETSGTLFEEACHEQ